MNKRIVVLGDRCVDLYWVGQVSGLSAEAPVPVVKQSAVLPLPGMAANVAKLLGDLGGVDVQLLVPENDHVPVKNRLVTEDGTQLARWDFEDWCTPYTNTKMDLMGDDIDAVILSDYSKGSVDSWLIKLLRVMAEDGIPLFIDTKGDPFVWAGLDNVTLFPNAKEYAMWQSHYDWMPSVVHKMGAQGMRFLHFGEEQFRRSAMATRVRNVCGAGDAVIATYTWSAILGALPLTCLDNAAANSGAYVEREYSDRSLVLTGFGAGTSN